MSPNPKHQGLGSPASSIGSHSESFGPLSQYHPSKYQQQSQIHEQIVSPLSTRFSPIHDNHSPTQGYLSPISLISPVLSVPSELLHRDNSIRETAPAASSSSQRPRTLYLADHQPHRLAAKPLPPVPAAVVKTKHHNNNNTIPNPTHRRDNERIAQDVDIEMQDINLNDTTTAPNTNTNTNTTLPLTKFDQQLEDGTYEAKRRRRHWIIIVLTVILLGGASAAFAVLAVKGTSSKVEITPG